MCYMRTIDPVVSEKKIFEIVDDGRWTDGRTPEHGYTISSPMSSGELKMLGRKQRRRSAPCNPEADQALYFRYMDSTIPLLLKSKISSF